MKQFLATLCLICSAGILALAGSFSPNDFLKSSGDSEGNLNKQLPANSAVTFTISGNVSIPGDDSSGVTINLQNAQGAVLASMTTNGSGTYSFAAEAGGSYIVTAAKRGRLFSPANHTISNLQSNQTRTFFGSVLCTPSPYGLKHFYKGEYSTADSVSDYPNYGAGAYSYGASRIGNAFYFYTDGNTYSYIPHYSNISISTWVYVSGGQGTNRDIAGKDGESSERQYMLSLADTNRFRPHIGSYNGNYYNFDGATVAELNRWYHVVMTYNGSYLYLYVNGNYDGGIYAPSGIINGGQPFRIGGGANFGAPGLFFRGFIDETQVYDRQLLFPEIQNLYNVGSSGNCGTPFTNTPSGSNISIAPAGNVSINFGNVGMLGTTVATPLGLQNVPALSPSYTALSNPPMYDIRTSAEFSGSTTVNFTVPGIADAATCAKLRVLQHSGAGWNETNNLPPTFNSGVCRVSRAVSSLGSHFTVASYNAPTVANQSQTILEDNELPLNLTAVQVNNRSLTYSIVQAPAHGTLSGSGANQVYTPNLNYFGTDSFQYKVSDGEADSNTATVSITVNPVNDAPVLSVTPSASGYWGNNISFSASAADVDTVSSALTFSLVNPPAGATINSGTGAVSWIPSSEQIGNQTITVRVDDNNSPSLFDQKSVSVSIGKRPVQLSITSGNSGQYSDETTVSASLVDAGGGNLNGSLLSGQNISFTLGAQTATAITENGAAGTDIVLNQAPASNYQLQSSFAGNAVYEMSNDTEGFTIEPEDARAVLTGAFHKATSSSSASTASVTLTAIIKDISEVDNSDTNAGDISTATVDFINRDTGAVLAQGVSVTPLAGSTTVGTASAALNFNIGNDNARTISIGVVVSGRYARNASDENTLVTVAKPLSTNFISGGGFLLMQTSVGTHQGDPDSKASFGFSVKHGSNNSNPSGGFTILVRNGGSVYQIKGNIISSFAVNNSNPLARTAIFTGAAMITDITDLQNPQIVVNTATVHFKLTDKGEPGTSDSIAIQIMDGESLWFSSKTDGAGGTVEQSLGINAGNLVFRYVSSPR